MKKILIILTVLVLIVFTGLIIKLNKTNDKKGCNKLAYTPIPGTYLEVHVSLTGGFNPTGWNGTAWTTLPNRPDEWNGSDKTLYTISASNPININNLTSGNTYFVRCDRVDQHGNRSAPNIEASFTAGYTTTEDLQDGSVTTGKATNDVTTGFGFEGIKAHFIFDSLDNIAKHTGGSSSISIGSGYVELATGTTINSEVKIQRSIYYPTTPPTWDKTRKFKTAISIQSSVSDVIAYIATGPMALITPPGNPSFGFKVVNNSLKGFTYNASENTVDLMTIWANETYLLESHLINGTVYWYVDGVLKGSSNSQIPTGTTAANAFYCYYLKNTAAANKEIEFSEFEFYQAP